LQFEYTVLIIISSVSTVLIIICSVSIRCSSSFQCEYTVLIIVSSVVKCFNVYTLKKNIALGV
jgi:hypothetical protein